MISLILTIACGLLGCGILIYIDKANLDNGLLEDFGITLLIIAFLLALIGSIFIYRTRSDEVSLIIEIEAFEEHDYSYLIKCENGSSLHIPKSNSVQIVHGESNYLEIQSFIETTRDPIFHTSFDSTVNTEYFIHFSFGGKTMKCPLKCDDNADIKVTSGEGVLSGDGDSFCIDPIKPDPWNGEEFTEEKYKKYLAWQEQRVYPSGMFPDIEGKVKYTVVVKVEKIE